MLNYLFYILYTLENNVQFAIHLIYVHGRDK